MYYADNPHRTEMFNVGLIFKGYFLPAVTSIWRNSICLIILNDSISLSEFWRAKIVIYVQDVRKKRLWENFLFIHFLKSSTFLKPCQVAIIISLLTFVSSSSAWKLSHLRGGTCRGSRVSTGETGLEPEKGGFKWKCV